MVIQHNLSAMNSHRQININNKNTAGNLEKLSSGFKINKAADDAAGLAISEKMRGQIRGLQMATQNAENGVSLIQTAEGGLNETHAILQRMRELAVQSRNGTYHDDVDRENLEKESQALKAEIDRISSYTNYNGIKLLDGSIGGTRYVDTDANAMAKVGDMLKDIGLDSITGITLAASFAKEAGSNLSGTLIVNNSGDLNLQIGDKIYKLATADDATKFGKTYNTGATFIDGDGNTIASLQGGTYTNPVTTVGNAATITGTVTVNFKETTAASGVFDAASINVNGTYVATSATSKLTFQIGANGTMDQRVSLYVDNMSSANLGTKGGSKVKDVDISRPELANDAITVLDDAINQVSATRADLGALQNRLEHTVNNLGVTVENLQSAESTIRDVDMAKEMMEFTKNNILVQASQSMLAQANQLPQGVLQLLR